MCARELLAMDADAGTVVAVDGRRDGMARESAIDEDSSFDTCPRESRTASAAAGTTNGGAGWKLE